MDELDEFKTSIKALTSDMVEIIRKLELEVESEDIIVFLHPNVAISTNAELLDKDDQRKWFLDKESTAGEML